MLKTRDDHLQSNSERWGRLYPKEALFLSDHEDPALAFNETAQGELNLTKSYPLHDPAGAAKEAKDWFKQLNIKDVDQIFVYGAGLGYYYEAAKDWLHADEKRSLVFFEDQLAVIHRLFQTELGERLLSDKQVRIHYFDSLEDDERSFIPLYWDYLRGTPVFTALKAYETHRSERYQDLKHKVFYDLSMKNAAIDEYMKFGVRFLLNFFPNLMALGASHKASAFYGKFRGVPAIICGAGPSLQKNCAQVAECLSNALVFGGGSAMNALNACNIHPHFGVGIDPNPMQAERLKRNTADNVPFFYRNRMHKEAFKLIRGPRLYVSGAGGYDIADWFDKRFGLETEEILDEGHNVVNFSIELARALGCDPIILVGVDLAFTNDRLYANGVEDAGPALSDEEVIIKTDIYGHPVKTLWKWVAESKWTAEYAKDHPDIRLINATEGGIGMSGIPNMDFAEARRRYLKKEYDLPGRIAAAMTEGKITASPEEVKDAILEMRASLERCLEQLAILLHDNQRLQTQTETEKHVPDHKQSGLAALAETELAEEPAYTEHLSIFNEVASRLLSKQLGHLKVEGKPDWEQLRDKCLLNAMKLKFLSEAAQAAIGTIDHAMQSE